MDTWVWILIVAVALIALAIAVTAAVSFAQRRRSEQLKSKFGPEYDRAVDAHGDQKRAEQELLDRKKRVEKYRLRPLSADERARFGTQWKDAQARFVDDPPRAIGDADSLVQSAMKARGFPTGGDFDSQTADISVEHPYVVEHYRAAHVIALANDRGEAETEELRQAMVHFRALFEELVNAPGDATPAEESAARTGSANRAGPADGREAERRNAGRLGNIQQRR